MSARMLQRFVFMLALALAGCGGVVRMAYNNGDVAARLMADDYFDLQGEQMAMLRVQLARFHEWHRREELPEYASMLSDAAGRVQRGLASADVAWAIAAMRERYRATVTTAALDAAPVLATLTPDNFRALTKKLDAENRKFEREFLVGDEQKRERARIKLLHGRFETWIGDLDEEQDRLIEAYVRAQPRLTAAMFEDRKRRQREFVQLLETRRTSPDLGAEVGRFVSGWEARRAPQYAQMAKESEVRLTQLIVDLDRSLSPKQRAHAVARLQGYAEDFRILALEGAAKQPARAAVVPGLGW